jgi:hypothetical protein
LTGRTLSSLQIAEKLLHIGRFALIRLIRPGLRASADLLRLSEPAVAKRFRDCAQSCANPGKSAPSACHGSRSRRTLGRRRGSRLARRRTVAVALPTEGDNGSLHSLDSPHRPSLCSRARARGILREHQSLSLKARSEESPRPPEAGSDVHVVQGKASRRAPRCRSTGLSPLAYESMFTLVTK